MFLMQFYPGDRTIQFSLYVCCKQTSMLLEAEKIDKSTSSLSLLTYVKTLIPICVNDSVPTENCLIVPSYNLLKYE